MAVDLHLHSVYSDGSETPGAIVERASQARLRAIALTDHDTLAGVDEAAAAAHAAGIVFVPGVELSVEWATGPMHLLVYSLHPGPGPLQDHLTEIQAGRARRNGQIVDRLRDLGIDVSLDEVTREAGGGGVGRPHFAAVLLRKGYVTSIRDAFDRYLAAGRPGYVNRDRLDAATAIRLARASGAVPVIAHPHTLGITAGEFGTAFEQLTAVGLGGIEAYYAEYRPEMRRHLAEICRDLGITPTGGSDFHGSYKPGLEVGTGYGDLSVPDDTLDDLR
jgi:predicted metal-dependent phosphoesterase TrpH